MTAYQEEHLRPAPRDVRSEIYGCPQSSFVERVCDFLEQYPVTASRGTYIQPHSFMEAHLERASSIDRKA